LRDLRVFCLFLANSGVNVSTGSGLRCGGNGDQARHRDSNGKSKDRLVRAHTNSDVLSGSAILLQVAARGSGGVPLRCRFMYIAVLATPRGITLKPRMRNTKTT